MTTDNTTNITIHGKATIQATGEKHGKRCKPVLCITDGTTYTSVTDAAKANGVTAPCMTRALQGKIKLCGGKRFCYLSEATQHLDEMTSNIRSMLEYMTELKRKADVYDAWEAEKEAARKAEEERLAAIAKAEEEKRKAKAKHDAELAREQRRKERYEDKCKRLEAQLQETIAKLMSTEQRIEELNNVEFDDAPVAAAEAA